MNNQLKLGEVDISAIKFDLRSRDDIPRILLGLQHLYCIPKLREQVFSILRGLVPEEVDLKNGRPGMHMWRIFVLGTLRLDCNWDFDRLHEMVNNHKKIREMLGHGLSDTDYHYSLQTLKDNLSLFTPKVLDKINQVVVSAGHEFLGKKKDEAIQGRCDSFVLETNVHYARDMRLLFQKPAFELEFQVGVKANTIYGNSGICFIGHARLIVPRPKVKPGAKKRIA
jgi:hypothetical protein